MRNPGFPLTFWHRVKKKINIQLPGLISTFTSGNSFAESSKGRLFGDTSTTKPTNPLKMKLKDIKTNQETSLNDFARLQSYRYNLDLFLQDFKKTDPYKYKRIKALEAELQQAKKSIEEMLQGKRNYSSFEYQSKINKI